MNASEVIKELEKMVREHGDLPCVAHDGLDPSDLCLVHFVGLSEGDDWFFGAGKSISIKSEWNL